MSTPSSLISFKVVLLGEGRVGKTSLCLRYVEDKFDLGQQSTIQATYLQKRLTLGKQSCKLMIWDTAGQERFHALGPIYYRDANAALLVYDITDRDSFLKVKSWVKELRKIVGPDIVLCIAGNKSDLEKKRQVDDSEARAYAEEVGAYHCLTSAKTGRGVEEAFLHLTKQLLQGHQSAAPARGDTRSRPGSKRSFVQIVDKAESDNKGCC